MLHVLNAAKQFKDRTIFSRFDLNVDQGGFKILLGPSGCGKTTLFNVLTGAASLDQGRIFWKEQEVPHLGSLAAYMQQKDMLLPWFSLFDNALLPAKIRGAEKQGAADQAGRFFKRLGLEGFESYMPGQVSGGMRQRCALARTLMFNREMVLLDEPLSALDTITRRGLYPLLLTLQSEFKKTILMITHDIEEALLLGDEVVLLSSDPMMVSRSFVLNQPKPRLFNDPELLTVKQEILHILETLNILETGGAHEIG